MFITNLQKLQRLPPTENDEHGVTQIFWWGKKKASDLNTRNSY